tara:strand:+ start:159 stop:1157 length:999 start_codon:yes stop_codon:yes gene_type:complete
MLLSICIPTYKREECLNNCLNSILKASKNINFDFEICVSDNCSGFATEKVVLSYKNYLNIKFSKNSDNLGFGVNTLKSVSMAQGEFVWILGNDDLLVPYALQKIGDLLKSNENIDFFYINSFHLSSNYVFKYTQPFDTNNLPQDMDKFSMKQNSETINFFDLINPKISFDFLLGIYLSVFKRKKWVDNLHVIDQELIKDTRTWSTQDNTFPHIKIFAAAFANSKAYFYAQPLSVNLYGEREWDNLYPFVEIIRIPECLDTYRKNGLKLTSYLYCKNFALRNFTNYIVKIILNRKKGGLEYISFNKHILKNIFYPNIYLSIIYFLFRKIFKKN